MGGSFNLPVWLPQLHTILHLLFMVGLYTMEEERVGCELFVNPLLRHAVLFLS